MPAEEVQELGREGVFLFKRWLEATTFLDLSWNAYGSAALCEVPHPGGVKTFDLAGMLLEEGMPPVVVECKRYNSPGKQPAEFEEFLAIAYGASIWEMDNGMRAKTRQFIWATTHPFSQTNWSDLTTEASIAAAVEKHPTLAGDKAYDHELGHAIAERIWLLVLSEKQQRIMLTPSEVLTVWKKLNRKKAGL